MVFRKTTFMLLLMLHCTCSASLFQLPPKQTYQTFFKKLEQIYNDPIFKWNSITEESKATFFAFLKKGFKVFQKPIPEIDVQDPKSIKIFFIECLITAKKVKRIAFNAYPADKQTFLKEFSSYNINEIICKLAQDPAYADIIFPNITEKNSAFPGFDIQYKCFDNPVLLLFFLMAGMNPNHQDNKLYSTLFRALLIPQLSVPIQSIELLLQAGADPNLTDFWGNTILHHLTIVFDAQEEIIQLLLAYGADPNIINKKDQSPYKTALRIQNQALISLFKKYPSLP